RRMVIVGFAVAFMGLAGTAVTTGFVENGAIAYWWLAVPLTLMGLSQGMTISPNQTLTLNSVDPRFGGVAGGILQLGQRTGAAIGTAMIPGIIFSLTESGKAWLEAFIIALTPIAARVSAMMMVSAMMNASSQAIIMALTLAAMGVSFADRA